MLNIFTTVSTKTEAAENKKWSCSLFTTYVKQEYVKHKLHIQVRQGKFCTFNLKTPDCNMKVMWTLAT